MQDLDQLFDKAYQRASKSKAQLPPDVMLRIYAYYKQATSGYSHHFEDHQQIDLIRAFKFNAWKQVSHLSKNEAKKLYIALINSLKL